MVAAQLSSLVARGVATMLCSCRGVLVVLMRYTVMVLLGADGYRFTLVIGRAMEWHQHCRQSLQGQSQHHQAKKQVAKARHHFEILMLLLSSV